MPREYNTYLKDILESINRVETYTSNLSFEKFKVDKLIQDAVVRNLEIIGEAANHIPKKISNAVSEVEWKKITGLRNLLIHEYFGIDIDIVWDIVKNKVPDFKKKISKILSEL